MMAPTRRTFYLWKLGRLLLLYSIWLPSIYSLNLSIKELVRIGSMRENQLAGYGLVVGLPQTGDSRSTLTTETLKRALSLKGVAIGDTDLKTKNVAVVMVTAKIPSVALLGDAIDIWVSSIGNAKSLKRGYLLQTPLSGADGLIYAVAQGSISSSHDEGGRNLGGGSSKDTTVFISNGALIEKNIVQSLVSTENGEQSVVFNLFHFDIGTANNIVNAINRSFNNSAKLRKDGSIIAVVSQDMDEVKFITDILKMSVTVESRAKVVMDPRSGTIVMGGNVGLSPVAVSKSGMSIRIGNPEATEQKEKNKKKTSLIYLEESPSVSELVDVLNKLGLDTRDIIDILKAIHSAGALHAELLII